MRNEEFSGQGGAKSDTGMRGVNLGNRGASL